MGDSELGFPRAVSVESGNVIVTNPRSGTHTCTPLDKVCIDDAETGRVLIEVREVLLESVLNGYSAALCVVGGPGTGKSRCLFGAHDLKSGLLPEFAETYYRRRGQQAAIGVIDVSVSQVYGEQVYDLLSPRHDCCSSNVSGLGGRTYHTANSRDEFLSLVADALSVRAALYLQSDVFPNCAHLHIQCACQTDWGHNTASFLEIGSHTFSMGTKTIEYTSTAEQSREALQKCVATGRLANAYLCDSMLTSMMVQMLTDRLRTIWLGCMGPTLVDIYESETTLALLAESRLLQYSSMSASLKLREPHYSPHLNHSLKERLRITREYKSVRNSWLATLGLESSGHGRMAEVPCLSSISPDVFLSHRLYLPVDKNKILIGSRFGSNAQNTRIVMFRVAGILPAHCIIYLTGGDNLMLEVERDALVSVNGERILDNTRKLYDGDHILLGQNILLLVHMSEASVRSQQVTWSMATRKFHHEAITAHLSHRKKLQCENWSLEQQLVTLSSMVFEANCVSDELKRDTRFRVKVVETGEDLFEPEPCVVVISERNDVADTWSLIKMSRRLAQIRSLRSHWFELYGRPSLFDTVADNLFYDPPRHELVGVGYTNK